MLRGLSMKAKASAGNSKVGGGFLSYSKGKVARDAPVITTGPAGFPARARTLATKVAEREPLVIPARPDSNGRYGQYGGKYVPETLMYALSVLEKDYARLQQDAAFQEELGGLLKDYVGRAPPLYFAER